MCGTARSLPQRRASGQPGILYDPASQVRHSTEERFVHGSDQTAEPGQSRGYGDVGDAVAGVLRAAEEAAEKIRGEARTQAIEIVEQAQGEASTRIAELTREAERTRTDADDYAHDIRAAVDRYGTEQRREADEEARQILADAQEQAKATREAAQEMAFQVQGEAQGRHERLRDEIRALEERRSRVLDDLRDLAAQLADLVPGHEPASRQADLLEALEVDQRN
jgi:F0F1-type ATP synthase membrane subunit b/b'